jgi:hypothetical protein
MGDDLFHVKTDGGIGAHHPARETLSIFVGPSTSDEFNTIKPGLTPVACLRIDDIRFEFDSSFIGPKATDELKLLAQLRKDSPGILGSVFGHADPIGDDVYNKQLSGRRAAAVYALLIRKVEIWEDIYSQKGKFTNPAVGDKWGIHAVQIMLTTLTFYGGPLNGKLDGPTQTSVEAFQRSPAGAGLNPDGDPGEKTRAKLFKAYMDAICVDSSGTPFTMDKAEFLAAGADDGGKGDYQGCSEFNPVLLFSKAENAAFQPHAMHKQRDQENQPNRRVLLFFFKPSSRITASKWPCPRVKEGVAACQARFFSDAEKRRSFQTVRREYKDKKETFACRFYDRLAIESPCEIGPPLFVNVLRVHLKLVWKDPDPATPPHVFPKDFPVVVVFGDGSTLDMKVAEGGKLEFEVERSKRSFTLNFQFSETQYLATATPATKGPGPERLVPESAAKSAIDDHYRVFALPLNSARRWELPDWDWTVSDIGSVGGTSIFNNNEFNHLEDVSVEVGLETAPAVMTLDPHWQYLRFEYFDRFFGHANHGSKRIGITPIVVEGFRQASASGSPPPDTRSNWSINDTDDAKSCQCLPWVVRRKADKTAEAKPDQNVLIRFRTAPGTFIQCTDPTTRQVVTAGGTAASTDPGLNSGASTNAKLNEPSPERLNFYDLPPVWLSRKYFTRPAAGAGKAFESLTGEIPASANNDPAQMLTFSLDDMVLCQPSGSGQPTPMALNAATDRVAIFSHLFDSDPANAKVSSLGLFDADPAKPYFSLNAAPFPNTNYISEYPNWTRLLVLRGNLFDVFDQRTPNVAGQVVGARAAMRWVDATSTGIGVAPTKELTPRPPRTIKPFFAIQPFFEQEYIEVTRTLSPGTYDFKANPDIPGGNRAVLGEIGRFDLSVLRCCDVDGDNEAAVSFQYYRFAFNFAKAPAPLNTNAAQQEQFRTDTVVNIPVRWNGPDGTLNPGTASIESKVATLKLKIKPMWFAQALVLNQAHFNLDVVSDKGRSFMASFDGTGELRKSANNIEPARGAGVLVSAHECGHAGSMPDEYSEVSTQCSYNQAPIRSNNIPGDPYKLDGNGMMQSNQQVRGRYFWHVAEWLRTLYGASYIVKHNNLDYEVPEHPHGDKGSTKPARNFLNWPRKAAIETRTTANNFDVYFYALGADKFSATKIKAGTQFHGIVVVMLKMKLEIPANASFSPLGTFGRISNDLQTINARLGARFNRRWRVSGSVGGTAFNDCLLHFEFRYLVPTITNEAVKENQDYIIDNGGSVSKYKSLAGRLETNHSIHLEIDVIDPPTSKTSRLSGNSLRLISNNYNNIDTFVAAHLGLSTAAAGAAVWPDQGQLLPIVGKVLTGATIAPF